MRVALDRLELEGEGLFIDEGGFEVGLEETDGERDEPLGGRLELLDRLGGWLDVVGRLGAGAVVRLGIGAVLRLGVGAVVRLGMGAVVRLGIGAVVRPGGVATDGRAGRVGRGLDTVGGRESERPRTPSRTRLTTGVLLVTLGLLGI